MRDQITYLPCVRYALFQPKDTDTNAMTEAYTAAKAMKDACGTISDLTGLAETAYKNGEILDYGDILVTKGQLDQNFEDWAYDENRKEGEMDVIYSPDFGYFVVGYVRTEKQISSLLYDIAMKDLTNAALAESNSGIHDFHTDDEYLPAPAAPTATPVPEIALPDDGTEESAFNPEATEASAPAGNQSQQNTSTKTADVLVVVFITLAGVAVASVIGVLIYSAWKNHTKAAGASDEDSDDDSDDDEAAESEKDSRENHEDESEEDGEDKDED